MPLAMAVAVCALVVATTAIGFVVYLWARLGSLEQEVDTLSLKGVEVGGPDPRFDVL